MAKKKVFKFSKGIKIFIGIMLVLAIYFVGGSFVSKKVVFDSCGSDLPNYKYSLEVPLNWIASRINYDNKNVDYKLAGIKNSLTVSCTTLGVGGDICSASNLKKFQVGGQSFEACYGLVNGQWKMGVLNLNRDPSNHASIFFTAQGVDIQSLNKILSTFKIESR